MTVQIIDDLVPKAWQLDLLESMKELTWVHQRNTSYKTGPGNFIQGMDVFVDKNTVDTIQFVHYAILGNDKTFMFPYLKSMVYMIEEKTGRKVIRVHRIKLNHQGQLPNFTKDNYNIPHSDDARKDLTTIIYYINDSDGDTFIFNEHHDPEWKIKELTVNQRVTPKMGRAVVFPSTQFHASSNPIDTHSRFVINFVVELE
jgi:hypothetical protein